MANYYAQTRTNYFAVKDPELFKAELAPFNVEIIENDADDGTTLYGFLDGDQNGGGLEWSKYNEEKDTYEDVDWISFLSRHVAPGHVAILMEIGSEKYRYFHGHAWAVNSKGEVRDVSLAHIYSLADELGDQVTQALY